MVQDVIEGIRISAEFTGSKRADWEGPDNWNHNKIVITKMNPQCRPRRATFDFWGSVVDPAISDEKGLGYALYCIVGDAIMGERTVDDFFAELGYEKVSAGLKAWNGCRKSREKLLRVLGKDVDLYELSNKLQEVYG